MRHPAIMAAATLALMASGALTGDAATPSQTTKVTKPREREISAAYDLMHQSVIRPAARAFDIARLGRKLAGNPREAANVDDSDQVRLPSTWWQPRIGFRAVSVEQMLKGPGPGRGPAPGPWTVTKAKSAGVSPGFEVWVDGQKALDVMAVPNTGGWQTWVTQSSAPFAMAAGNHTLRLKSIGKEWNLNWLKVNAQ